MALLIFYFLLAVGVSFLCSILEAVLLSLTPSFVEAARDAGTRAGKLLDRLKMNVDRPLAGILSLNTMAHTFGAAGVGAQAQLVFENLSVTVISAVLTLMILVLSEIIPKTLGAVYWRALAHPSAYAIEGVTVLMAPFVALSRVISRIITPSGTGTTISRDEIHAMADIGQREGVLHQADAHVLRSVMRFNDVLVDDVFTPRSVVQSLEAERTVREVLDSGRSLGFSRFPVFRKDGSIAGFALRRELLDTVAAENGDRTIGELVHPVAIIPEKTPLRRVFGQFLRKREHMAVVVDEYGSFAGVLTLEDVIESLIGHEIMDEEDEVADMRSLARERPDDPPLE